MSPRSGKVMALFPPHTTDMMSFFSFFSFLVAAWAAILVCAELLLMGLHADVRTGHWREGAHSCLFDSQLVRLSAHLPGPPSARLPLFVSVRKVSVLSLRYTLLMMITRFWWRKEQNPFLSPPLHYGSVVTDRDVVEGKIIQTQLPNL